MATLAELFKRYHPHTGGDDEALIRAMSRAWADQIELWATFQIKFHNWPYCEIEKVVATVRAAKQQGN